MGSDTCGHEASLPHSFDRLILGQVERQQLCISYIEASIAEVDVLLLGLNAAEGDELRQLSSSGHDNVGAITEAQYVAEGRPTASSVVAEARNTNYIQVALAKQLPLDTLPELLEVGEAENDRPNR